MKLGISTYSLYGALRSGELTPVGILEAAARMGAEHVEIATVGFSLDDNPGLVRELRQAGADLGLSLSNYATSANFSDLSEAAFLAEIDRLKRQVDIAAELGVSRMRHDIAFSDETSIRHFRAELPRLAEACRTVADYAAGAGIVTSIENHGYYVQASDRVLAVVHETNRDNFRITLDIGNFLCVDEEPLSAVANCLPYASIVHIKDFYRRPPRKVDYGEGWLRTAADYRIRGAIAGQGDLPMERLLRLIKRSGYDGELSIEFEGLEECRMGTKASLDAVRSLWDSIDIQSEE